MADRSTSWAHVTFGGVLTINRDVAIITWFALTKRFSQIVKNNVPLKADIVAPYHQPLAN